jgi:serpin B
MKFVQKICTFNIDEIDHRSLSAFNSKMFYQISHLENGNIIYSPLCLHMALFQIYLGSPKGSTTSKELSALLEVNPEEDEKYLNSYKNAIKVQMLNGSLVTIANKIFVDDNFEIKSYFKSIVAKYLKSHVDKVNFSNSQEASGVINNFVNKATNGLISKILDADDIDSQVKIILVNAIYFKGNWKNRFEKSKTTMMTFHKDGMTQTKFSGMMMTAYFKMADIPELDSTVLKLPYQNEHISMIVILPSENTDIHQVEMKLKDFEAKSVVKKLDSIPAAKVEVILPKFEMTFNVPRIIESLESLGVQSLFDNPDLSLVSESPLFVSKIAQKATVKVNEEGSEAAAVTSGVNHQHFMRTFLRIFWRQKLQS